MLQKNNWVNLTKHLGMDKWFSWENILNKIYSEYAYLYVYIKYLRIRLRNYYFVDIY